MAKYTAKDFKDLSKRIQGKTVIVNKASALTVNKSATFGRKESITQITKEVNLKPAYVGKGLKVVKRASPDDLVAIVRGNVRGTLLERYPYSLSENNARVQINRAGSSLEIKGARMIVLKGSGEKVIGMFNKDFMEVLTKGLSKGAGSTPGKRKKLHQVERAAAKAPHGRQPLHSRSVNQLFLSKREEIKPQLKKFMRESFLEDFYRLNK